jgi:zinc protease
MSSMQSSSWPLRPLLAGLLGCCALATTAADKAPADADRIVARTLDNGLKVIVWPDHDIPSVAMYTWYRAGGRNEYPGITGIAHYFEHMMFNGTTTRAPGEFDRIMEAHGGSNNAYTSNDVTVYQDWFPSSALALVIDLEGDRMANLDFDPAVVESERGVVYSERRLRIDNDNFGMLWEQVQATAFVAHPYQFPVIGWPSDIEAWTIDQLRDFYRQYYAPNNASLLVVGAVEPDEVFALLERHVGPIAAQPAPRAVTTVEPEQQGERRVVLRRDAQAPLLLMAWHATRASDDDAVPLELLNAILTGGDSSRLHRALVEESGTALRVGGMLQSGFDPGLFMLFATLPPGGDTAALEARIDAELRRIATDGVSDAELAKARKQQIAAFWRGMATISGKAQALGTYEVFHGDHRKLFDAPARYAAVTADDLKRVATRYLHANNRTVGTVLPPLATEATR